MQYKLARSCSDSNERVLKRIPNLDLVCTCYAKPRLRGRLSRPASSIIQKKLRISSPQCVKNRWNFVAVCILKGELFFVGFSLNWGREFSIRIRTLKFGFQVFCRACISRLHHCIFISRQDICISDHLLAACRLSRRCSRDYGNQFQRVCT
jgi:hypothetical protein